MGLCTVKRILLSAEHWPRADVLLQHARRSLLTIPFFDAMFDGFGPN
jgi:hypothetical protein